MTPVTAARKPEGIAKRRTKMYEEVKALLAKQLKLKDPSVIRPDSKIQAELGADSIDVLQLLMTLEEQKGITIPDEELMKFVTVQDIVDYLEKRV